ARARDGRSCLVVEATSPAPSRGTRHRLDRTAAEAWVPRTSAQTTRGPRGRRTRRPPAPSVPAPPPVRGHCRDCKVHRFSYVAVQAAHNELLGGGDEGGCG